MAPAGRRAYLPGSRLENLFPEQMTRRPTFTALAIFLVLATFFGMALA